MTRKPATLLDLEILWDELREHERVTLDIERCRAILECPLTMAETIMHDGRILGIVAAIEMWQGVYDVAVFPSVHVPNYALTFVRAVKEVLKDPRLDAAHRLQTCSLADDQTNKWMTILGFEYEGKLRKYTKNKDSYRMWAIVR